MKKILIIITLIFLISIPKLQSELYWDGRYYQQSLLSFRTVDEKLKGVYIGFSMLDLKLDAEPSELVRVQSEIQYSLMHQNQTGFLAGTSPQAIDINTLKAIITPEDFKFTFGRFLPAWGKSKVFRPLDIFIPQTYFLNVLSYPGIDGFSMKYYPSDLSSIEFLAIPSLDVRTLLPQVDQTSNSPFMNPINHPVAAINAEFHIGTFDNNLILINENGSANNLIGFTCKGDAIIGLWSELYYSFNAKKKQDKFKGSIGADYSFAKYYFVTAEYFYDRSGKKNYQDYNSLFIYQPRMTYGQQYLMLDFNVITYTEQNFGLTYLGNLVDQSFILFPYYRYEILENCMLGLSLYHFNGKTEREFAPTLLGNYILNSYLVIRF
jgi:hypothetical protein